MAIESNLKAQKGKKHVLVIPVSLQAHIAGILRQSIELAKRGVTVTFVGLEQEITLLKTLDELQGLDFNLVSYSGAKEPTPGQPYIFTFLATVQSLFQPIREKLLADRKAGLPGPTCVMGDRFLTWAVDVAKELEVPYYQFFSCGADFVRILQSYPPLFADGTLTPTEPVPEGFLAGKRFISEFEGKVKIPGLPPLEFREIVNSYLGVDHFVAMGEAMPKSDGMLINTFYELEAQAVDAIRQFFIENSPKKTPRLFLVGPLSTAVTFKVRSFMGDLDVEGIKYLQWLDGHPPRSVIYFCLGSIAEFTPEQAKEVALAVEASGQRFLWVIKEANEKALPPDFEARTGGKVLTVSGWVPQLQILQHPSIGGFVTHCGWNSIIESVSCGVPMACWPQLKYDQFLNCRYLVDVLKIAVEVRPQEAIISTASSPNRYEEFEKAVRLLMSSEKGEAIRSRVQDLKKKAAAVIADGGASKKAFDDFVEFIPE